MSLCAVLSACGTGAPTTPSSGGPNLAGQWGGTTSQGTPIAFTISPDQKVTELSVGYSFNGCSGSQTFTGLNLDTAPNVTCIPAPCPGSVSSYRAFGYSSGRIDEPATSVNGLFLSSSTAQGLAGFANYPGCGTALSVPWSAAKR